VGIVVNNRYIPRNDNVVPERDFMSKYEMARAYIAAIPALKRSAGSVERYTRVHNAILTDYQLTGRFRSNAIKPDSGALADNEINLPCQASAADYVQQL